MKLLMGVVLVAVIAVLAAMGSFPGGSIESDSDPDSKTASHAHAHQTATHSPNSVSGWPILPTTYYMGIAVPPDTGSEYRYYMATNAHLTWASALERCRCMGLELISIDSPAEFLYLNRLIAASGAPTAESFWTAGNDKTVEGSYTWANNGHHFTAADFLPPSSGQPDDDTDPGVPQDCVSLRKVFPGTAAAPNPVTKDAWIMNDESCTDSELLYICREKL